MIKVLSFYILFLLFSLMKPLYLYPAENNYFHVLNLIYNYEFIEFNNTMDSLMTYKPNSPELYFLKATNYWWLMVADPYNEDFSDKFLYFSRKLIEVEEKKLNNRIGNDDLLLLGGAYGYIGRYYVMNGNWKQAYKFGKKGKNYLERLIEIQPSNNDAIYGLGIYHYYADLLPGFIKILLFFLRIDGNKNLGISELKVAAKSSGYSKIEAKSFLGFIDIYFEKKYGEAIHLFGELKEEFPNNIQFRKLLAEAWKNKGDINRAISIYKNILNNYTGNFVSLNEKAEIYASLGFCYQLNEDYKKASLIYNEMLNINTSETFFIQCPWKYFNIAFCFEKSGNYIQAINYYNKAIKCKNVFGYRKRAIYRISIISKE